MLAASSSNRGAWGQNTAQGPLEDYPCPKDSHLPVSGPLLMSLLPWSRSGEVTVVLGPLLQGQAPASFQRGEAKLILTGAGPWGARPRLLLLPFDGENDG